MQMHQLLVLICTPNCVQLGKGKDGEKIFQYWGKNCWAKGETFFLSNPTKRLGYR